MAERDTLRTWGPVLLVLALLPVAFVLLRLALPPIGGGEPPPAPVPVAPAPAEPEAAPARGCVECHAEVGAAWQTSTHARAERLLGPDLPAAVPGIDAAPVRALGVDPLVQFLIPGERGRLQVSQLAWDPRRDEWFDVFDDGRKPGEWGHWTGGGMNWNARCASCHDTGVVKGYDFARDTYATTVAEHGVGCAACHDPARHEARPDASVCGPCHARRAELDGDWKPGDALLDHFAPSLVDRADTFFPDGQVRDEDFEYTAFLGSKMHEKGVTCLSCHDPHTGRTLREGDALCLGCHEALPGWAAHDRHEEPVGCVGCHMPVTTYMQRDPRHDHGFRIPDPWLHVEHGVPDACSRCHADRGARWALAQATAWYGDDLGGEHRPRADAIARARAGDVAAIPTLLRVLREDGPAWRAAAAAVLEPFLDRDEVRAALIAALADPDGHVRFAAAGALAPWAPEPSVDRALAPLLRDPLKAVRVQASRALAFRLDPGRAPEYAAYLAYNADQPQALHERGAWAIDLGRPAEAVRDLERAVALDPAFVPAREALAIALAAVGRADDAAAQLREAVRLAPDDPALWYRLGLGEAGRNDLAAAEAALDRSVALDPAQVRAWYNLGLVRQALGRHAPALEALRRASALAPQDPEMGYALASTLLAQGRAADARREAERVLALAPDHPGARAILAAR